MNKVKAIKKILSNYPNSISFNIEDNLIFLNGELDKYEDKVKLGLEIAKTKLFDHVVNKITIKGIEPKKMRVPPIEDKTLNNLKVDVLIIGAGITGTSTFRELTKYNLSVLLIDKEDDVGLHASGRNDGNIHVGIDIKNSSKKFKYLKISKTLNEDLFKKLDVEYKKFGQSVAFKKKSHYLPAYLYLKRKAAQNSVKVEFYKGKDIKKIEPNISEDIAFIAYFPEAGQISPFEYVIALTESGIINGGKVSLNTYVKDMEVSENKIISVLTNRGRIYPQVVINAAGAFSEDIAIMAKDHFFSIHPRKGTDAILDSKIFSKLSKTSIGYRDKLIVHSSTKGGGVIPTTDFNTLVGPTAVEVMDKEDHVTYMSSIDEVIKKNQKSIPHFSKRDIIAYFSGIRAATYEEDFIVEKGRKTHNIIHLAGIQSPGLSAASGIALEASKLVKELIPNLSKKDNFIEERKGITKLNKLDYESRDKLIKSNPDYGHIICRCEEVSKGEIIDAINRPLEVYSIDAIKRRVRPGMGRCQGSFCQPLITAIIVKEKGIKLEEVKRKGFANVIVGSNKEINVNE